MRISRSLRPGHRDGRPGRQPGPRADHGQRVHQRFAGGRALRGRALRGGQDDPGGQRREIVPGRRRYRPADQAVHAIQRAGTDGNAASVPQHARPARIFR